MSELENHFLGTFLHSELIVLRLEKKYCFCFRCRAVRFNPFESQIFPFISVLYKTRVVTRIKD